MRASKTFSRRMCMLFLRVFFFSFFVRVDPDMRRHSPVRNFARFPVSQAPFQVWKTTNDSEYHETTTICFKRRQMKTKTVFCSNYRRQVMWIMLLHAFQRRRVLMGSETQSSCVPLAIAYRFNHWINAVDKVCTGFTMYGYEEMKRVAR